jgi:glycerol-1-phosphate dehydrogenase [NAD(P)+]
MKKEDYQKIRLCGTYQIGDNVFEEIGSSCRELGLGDKALLVNDEITWKIAGERISENLKESGFTTENVTTERGAVMSEVNKTRRKIRETNPSIVLGIGGGANIDITKVAASYEHVKYVVLPTIFATDAMATNVAVIWDMRQHDVVINPMEAVFVDTQVIKDSPWRFQAAGFADYIAKLTAIYDWDLSYNEGIEKQYCPFSITLAEAQSRWLLENTQEIKNLEKNSFETFIKILLTDGFLLEMAGNVRILAGSDHMVAEALDKEYKPGSKRPLHGEVVGVSTILMSCLQGGDWQTIKKALQDIGAPVTAGQINFEDDAIIRGLLNAQQINRNWMKGSPGFYSVLLKKPLNEKTAYELAKKTGVIE